MSVNTTYRHSAWKMQELWPPSACFVGRIYQEREAQLSVCIQRVHSRLVKQSGTLLFERKARPPVAVLKTKIINIPPSWSLKGFSSCCLFCYVSGVLTMFLAFGNVMV